MILLILVPTVIHMILKQVHNFIIVCQLHERVCILYL